MLFWYDFKRVFLQLQSIYIYLVIYFLKIIYILFYSKIRYNKYYTSTNLESGDGGGGWTIDDRHHGESWSREAPAFHSGLKSCLNVTWFPFSLF